MLGVGKRAGRGELEVRREGVAGLPAVSRASVGRA
jgi:hypothetical protein